MPDEVIRWQLYIRVCRSMGNWVVECVVLWIVIMWMGGY